MAEQDEKCGCSENEQSGKKQAGSEQADVADIRRKQADKKRSDERSTSDEESNEGEYGLEYLMAPEEESMERAREQGQYRFSEEQLEHKSDRIVKSDKRTV